MKKLKLILILSCICVSIQAQNQAVVDSLENLLESNLSDKQRINVWNGLAKEYSSSDSSKTIFYQQFPM